MQRNIITGCLWGILAAVAGLTILWLNDGRSRLIETPITFVFGVPVLIGFELKTSDVFLFVYAALYWALVGGAIGWAIFKGFRIWAALTAALVVLHAVVFLQLMREMEAIGRALEAIFGVIR